MLASDVGLEHLDGGADYAHIDEVVVSVADDVQLADCKRGGDGRDGAILEADGPEFGAAGFAGGSGRKPSAQGGQQGAMHVVSPQRRLGRLRVFSESWQNGRPPTGSANNSNG